MKKKMLKKILYKLNIGIYCSLLCSIPFFTTAQDDSTKKSKRESLIYLQFNIKNNQVPYLKIQTKNKTDEGFHPASKIPVNIYLDEDLSKDAVVGQVMTDDAGEAIVGLPPSLAAKWKSKPSHAFIAHTEASSAFDAATKEVAVTIARLQLDTVVGASSKSVIATVSKNEGGSWKPMGAVDLRIGVKRSGGYLTVGEEDTYSTDSTGKVEVQFVRENLPGDKSGNLEVVALVDDNDEIGSLSTGLTVPWGVRQQYKSDFGERSLWATPRRAPIWLLLMAYGCIIAVWSVIIYLFTRILQIRRLGKAKG